MAIAHVRHKSENILKTFVVMYDAIVWLSLQNAKER